MAALDEADRAALVEAGADAVIDVRRTLHARPELAFEEHETTALVRERLESLGAALRPCPTETGAVAVVEGGRPGPTVVLRADLDGLPVQEAVDLAFASGVEGVMHACGHDAHTAILLGVAAVLAERREELSGRVALLFLPAEELGGGATAMLDGGVLDGLDASAVLGLHVATLLPVGLVGVKPGVAMAGADTVTLRLRGAGLHGAMAGTQGNVVLAAAALASRLGEVVEGLVTEGVGCACAAGVLQAGTAANVVPTTATVAATLRTFDAHQRELAVTRLHGLAASVGAAFAVSVDVELPLGVPPVVNDPAVTATVRSALEGTLGSAKVLDLPPVTPSDDVSELLERVPGCYFFVSAGPTGRPPPMHHAPDFELDEACLSVGVSALLAGAVGLLRRR